jgi:hypothetical protein
MAGMAPPMLRHFSRTITAKVRHTLRNMFSSHVISNENLSMVSNKSRTGCYILLEVICSTCHCFSPTFLWNWNLCCLPLFILFKKLFDKRTIIDFRRLKNGVELSLDLRCLRQLIFTPLYVFRVFIAFLFRHAVSRHSPNRSLNPQL